MNIVKLPVSSAIFVGRTAELGEIARLLSNPACRLLTLVGPGGIGKTQLAVEAARRLVKPDTAYFVPLQPLNSPDYIVAALADAVGFQSYGNDNLKPLLLTYLHEKSWLLVLDNFEHLLDGAALLSEILAAAPSAWLLVTSRERLNLVEEWVLEVGGLPYPASGSDADLAGYSAVELFVQHARRINTSFEWNEAKQAAVGRICRLVNGMPLAIELAANWVRVLSCDAIADEIEHSLDILETPARNVEPRHRTMRAAFEPTWERLSDDERSVFMRLSVFRGGFTREAAEQVAGASLLTLSALVDKSLLRVDANARYDLHELLRQYAADKLQAAGEADTIAQRHLDYFLKFAEQVEAHNFGRDQIDWYDRAETELDNLRAALVWSLNGDSAEGGLNITTSMRAFWEYRGHVQEGLSWSERILAVTQDISPSLRAKALYRSGELAGQLYRFEQATTFCTEALHLARQVGDPRLIAWALSAFGYWTERVRETSASAVPMLDESLALFREIGDAYGLSHALRRRAVVAIAQKNYAYANTLLIEALARARAVGDKQATAWSLQILGDTLLREGRNPNEAIPLFEESLSLFRELKDSRVIVWVITLLGRILHLAGSYPYARSLYEEALALMLETGINKMNMYRYIFTASTGANSFTGTEANMMNMYRYCLAGLGTLLEIKGWLYEAAHLLIAAKWFDWFDLPLYPATEYDSQVASLHARLGEGAWAKISAEAKAMTWEQAASYALQQVKRLKETAQPTILAGQSPVESLSARELEVLRLMADGLSNGEIADQLVLATSTVKWYVRQLFSKLDATSRTQAVARARVRGLLGSTTQ